MTRAEVLKKLRFSVPEAAHVRVIVAPAPILNADLTYSPNPEGKLIRIYDWIDSRLTIQDLFCKMQLAYRT